MRLTEEQKKVVSALKEAQGVKVNAYAGTGKTTTLVACAEAYPGRKFLFLAFNRSVAEELRRKLPSNCTVHTIHGLAYRLTKPFLNFEVEDRKVFVDRLSDILGDFMEAKLITTLFENYCNSEFTEISEKTVLRLLERNYRFRRQVIAYYSKSKRFEDAMNAIFRLSGEKSPIIRKLAEELAEKLEYVFYAVSKKSLPITHDYYLKVMQLEFDRFSWFFKKFDYLAVDEAQDVNGVQEFLLRSAPVPGKIAVGDRHQQIYSWRLALNTLSRLKGWEDLYLTVSFRFHNDEIVETTNAFLKGWKGEKNLLSVKKSGRRTGKKGVLTRTNAKLVERIAKLSAPFRLTRPLEEVFRPVRQAEKLLDYYHSRDPFFLEGLPGYVKALAEGFAEKASSPEEYARMFELIGEEEYAVGILIAMKYDVEAIYRKAKSLYRDDANLVLSTAHSAKGLEFDVVEIESDFKPLENVVVSRLLMRGEKLRNEEEADEIVRKIQGFDELYGDVIDEIDLYYVAYTRALYRAEGPGASAIRESFSTPLTGKLLVEVAKKRFVGDATLSSDLTIDLWRKTKSEKEDPDPWKDLLS